MSASGILKPKNDTSVLGLHWLASVFQDSDVGLSIANSVNGSLIHATPVVSFARRRKLIKCKYPAQK